MRRVVTALLLALVDVIIPGRGLLAQDAARGTVSGVVQAAPTNVPLPYAVVSIPALGLERFSGGEGRFLLTGVAAGTHELLVRRIGFVPQRQQITVSANGTTSVTVSLVQVPVRLTGMLVRPTDRCRSPGLPDSVRFPEVAQLVGLLRENASTYRALVRRCPFAYAQLRAMGDLVPEGMEVRSVDTVAVPSMPTVQYRPGRVVQTEPGSRESFMAIPSIIDLVDPAFVANHCFTYAGASVHGNETWFRLDVRAAERLRSPDVHGAFYLDSASAQLRRMELELSRPDRLPAALRAVRGVIAHSNFVEIAPGLSILESVCAVNWRRANRGAAPRHAAELQTTVAWEFTAPPPDIEKSTTRDIPPWQPGARLDRSVIPCSAAGP